MIIYIAYNSANGKIYVGQTTRSLRIRWNSHVSAANRGDERYFQKAIRKYGRESFDLQEIACAETKERINNLERLYIILFRSMDPQYGYNLSAGGDGPLGWRPSEEQKRKHSEALKGRVGYWQGKTFSEEHIENLRVAMTGNTNSVGKFSGENNYWFGKKNKALSKRNKENPPQLGKKATLEHRQNISNALKGRVFSILWRKRISRALKKRARLLKEKHLL